MAHGIQRRLSRIENFFSMLLAKKGIADQVIVGELPPTTDKEWETFVNIDVGQQTDKGAYSTGFANIYLYARPKGSPPVKNVKALDKMEGILDEVIASSRHKDYSIHELYRNSGYDTQRQFHFNMVSVSVITK